jgi:hypothetical protein
MGEVRKSLRRTRHLGTVMPNRLFDFQYRANGMNKCHPAAGCAANMMPIAKGYRHVPQPLAMALPPRAQLSRRFPCPFSKEECLLSIATDPG